MWLWRKLEAKFTKARARVEEQKAAVDEATLALAVAQESMASIQAELNEANGKYTDLVARQLREQQKQHEGRGDARSFLQMWAGLDIPPDVPTEMQQTLNEVQLSLGKITLAAQKLAAEAKERKEKPQPAQTRAGRPTPIQVDEPDEVLEAETPAGTPAGVQTPHVAFPPTPGQSTACCPTPIGTPRTRNPADAEAEAPQHKRLCGAGPSCS